MPPLTLVFDPATALLVRQRYRVAAPRSAAPSRPKRRFSDFRDVGGLKVAFTPDPRRRRDHGCKRTSCGPSNTTCPLDPALFTKSKLIPASCA